MIIYNLLLGVGRIPAANEPGSNCKSKPSINTTCGDQYCILLGINNKGGYLPVPEREQKHHNIERLQYGVPKQPKYPVTPTQTYPKPVISWWKKNRIITPNKRVGSSYVLIKKNSCNSWTCTLCAAASDASGKASLDAVLNQVPPVCGVGIVWETWRFCGRTAASRATLRHKAGLGLRTQNEKSALERSVLETNLAGGYA